MYWCVEALWVWHHGRTFPQKGLGFDPNPTRKEKETLLTIEPQWVALTVHRPLPPLSPQRPSSSRMGCASVIKAEIQAVIQQPRQNHEWTPNRYLSHCFKYRSRLDTESRTSIFLMSCLFPHFQVGLIVSALLCFQVLVTYPRYLIPLYFWSSPCRL